MIKKSQLAAWAAVAVLPLSFAVGVRALSVPGEDLTPRWIGDQLQVSAPKLHFISGKQLERLHNGAAVPFDFQLSLAAAGAKNVALERALERFVVSYDLWEEKFAVVRLRNSRRSGAHLTATAAEAWCLDNISLPTNAIPTDKGMWVRLEIRSAELKSPAQISEDGGVSLATLIELFSHPVRSSQDHWTMETGPFRLADVKR